MSRHHEPTAGGAGADEEFIDPAPEHQAPVDGGAEPKPDSKAKASGEEECGRVAGAGKA